MRRTNPPTPRRRTVLKLLAGSIAGAGLSTGAAKLAFPDETRAVVGDSAMRLEFDSTLRSRVTARQGDGFEPLTDFEPSETLEALQDAVRATEQPNRDQRSGA
jgi:alpha-galactosidase